MHDLRLRMVVVGLVLGVIVAVIFAAQGCGGTKHGRRADSGSRIYVSAAQP